MRRQVGPVSGILAVLAVLFQSEFSPERGKSGVDQATISEAPNKAEDHSKEAARRPAEEKARGELAQRSRPEDTVEGPWLAIRRFFGTSSGSRSRLSRECGVDFSMPASRALSRDSNLKQCQVRTYLGLSPADNRSYPVIVATVSDPVHSHLALYTDHQIEGILAGFQSAGWDFAGQWFPWSDSFLGEQDSIAERRESRALLRAQENIPGVLIFRSGVPGPCSTPWDTKADISWPLFCQDTLFVLIVPESPTAGINPGSFNTAMQIALALSGKKLPSTGISSPQYRVALLAPTFTGSFFSLARLINGLPADVNSVLSRTVYTGTASGFQYAEAFQDSTCFRFLGNSASSADFIFAFTELLKWYKLREDDVAWVVEDDTGFSRSTHQALHTHEDLKKPLSQEPAENSERPCILRNNPEDNKPELIVPQTPPQPPRWDIYPYPREISHLRNAYREQETVDSGNPGQQLASRVLLSLKDPNAGEDAVPVFDVSHTPVAQLAVIDSIVRDLRDRQKRLVVVTATNPLDLLFLTKVIRKGSPGTRIVVESPDAVFLSAEAQGSLAGTLMLSSYPLTLGGQDWRHLTLARPPQSYEWRGFTSPLTEGVFRAVLRLLAAEAKKSDETFDPKFEPEFRPAVWLLELTRNRAWPLQVFDESKPKTFKWYPDTPDATYPKLARTTQGLAPPRLSLAWILTTAVSVLLAMSFLGIVFWNRGRRREAHFWRYMSVPDARGWTLLALSGLMLSVNSVILLLVVPYYCLVLASNSVLADLAKFFVLTAFVLFILMVSLWGVVILTYRVFANSARKAAATTGTGEAPKPRQVNANSGFKIEASPRLAQASLLILWFGSVALWFWTCYPNDWSSVFFCFRALAIFSGASPVLPLLLFACGFFVRFLILSHTFEQACSESKPQLSLVEFKLLPLDHSYDKLEKIWSNAGTNAVKTSVLFLVAVVSIALLLAIRFLPWFAAFEMSSFNWLVSMALSALLIWLVLDSIRLYSSWNYLSGFLSMLGSMRIQRSFRRVTRDWQKRLAWAPPSRDTLALSCQQTIEAVHNWSLAEGSPDSEQKYQDLRVAFEEMTRARAAFQSPAERPESQTEHTKPTFQKQCAEVCEHVLIKELCPFWKESISDDDPGVRPSVIEKNSELLQEEKKLKTILYGSNFVALQFAAYIVYAVRQVHRTAKSLYFGIIFIVLMLLSYHPQNPRVVAGFVGFFFVAIAALIFYVLSGMQRDRILSFLSKTEPGELNLEFWTKMIALGGIPLIGVVSHLFPSVSSFLFSWVSPGIKAME